MEKDYVIASDIDGTLKHDGYIHRATLDWLKKLSKYAIIAVVTGKRERSYEREPIQYARFVALENGCILKDNGKRDEEWERRIDKDYDRDRIFDEVKSKYPEKYLDKKKYMVIIKYRTLEERDRIKKILDEIPEKNFKIYENEGTKTIEILPKNRGKGKVIERISFRTSIPLGNFYGIGDSRNDIDMLKIVGHPNTFESASDDVKKVVKEKNGYITPFDSHRGIQDILQKIYEEIRR